MSGFRYLFADTVEAHLSPLLYRGAKVGGVAALALLGHAVGLSLATSAAIAGLTYWALTTADAVVDRLHPDPMADDPPRNWGSLALDKVRDAALAALPWALATRHWPAVVLCVAVNVALLRVKD